MRGRTRVMVTAAFLVMALGGPAAADHTPPGEPFVPEYVETETFLHCNGSTVGNNPNGTRVPFDTTEPTDSVTSGAGCGTVDTFLIGAADHNSIYDFPVQGSFTGNIDNITLLYYGIDFCGSRALEEWTVDIHMLIDGQTILARNENGTATQAYAPTQESGDGVTRIYEVTVTKIGFSSESDHTAEHDIEITVYPKFLNGSGCVVWVYDAAEVPSGLVINDTTPAAVRVPRNG